MNFTAEHRKLVRGAAMIFAEQVEVVIPINTSTKQPYWALLPRNAEDKASWDELVKKPHTAQQVGNWFDRAPSLAAYALATGIRGRVVLDFDVAGFYEEWRAAVGNLADGLTVVRSGSGSGNHVHFVTKDPCGNIKLAFSPDAEAENGRKTAIETRGVGGYIVMPPSGHPTGGMYELVEGELELDKLKVLSAAHVEALFQTARGLCKAPFTKQELARAAEATEQKQKQRAARVASGKPSVIDEFNGRNLVTELLLANGYRRCGRMLVRPGKDENAGSILINDDNTSFHFSTNDPLHDGKTHDPFDVYCLYHHNGDVRQAVKGAAQEMGMDYASEQPKTPPPSGKEKEKREWAPKTQDGERPNIPLPDPTSAADLMQSEVVIEPPYIVDGLIREKDVAAIVSGSKSYKTFTGIGLAVSLAAGRCWLNTFPTHRKRVLYIDNELRPGTFRKRLKAICSAMAVQSDELREWLDVWSLRGLLKDIRLIESDLRRFEVGRYGLIVLDSLYKLLPDDVDENSNTQMGAVFNLIDHYTELTGAAFLVIHHQPKGDMSGRDVMDMGSGAGAFGRAVDTMMALRRHEQEHAAVLQARTRTSPDPEPMGMRFTFPTWTPDAGLDVAKLYKPSRGSKTAMPAVDPIRDGEAKRAAEVAQEAAQAEDADRELIRFIEKNITDVFTPKKTITSMALLNGWKLGKGEALLLAAHAKGRIHLLKGKGPRDPDRYANRPPNLAEIAGVEVPPSENDAKPSKRKAMRKKIG